MKRFLKGALAAVVLAFGLVAPAWAQMPQSDAAFVKLLADKPAEQQVEALALYYGLHVSEITLQLNNEINTGAFFDRADAQAGGDEGEIATAQARLDKTSAALKAARAANQKIRRDLGELSGVAFDQEVSIAPDAPDELPPLAQGAPADLAAAREAAFAEVKAARAAWQDMRLQLLEDQERYDEKRDIRLGDSMRNMTRAEIKLIEAVTKYRLVEAKIAAATGQSIAEVLSGL